MKRTFDQENILARILLTMVGVLVILSLPLALRGGSLLFLCAVVSGCMLGAILLLLYSSYDYISRASHFVGSALSR